MPMPDHAMFPVSDIYPDYISPTSFFIFTNPCFLTICRAEVENLEATKADLQNQLAEEV